MHFIGEVLNKTIFIIIKSYQLAVEANMGRITPIPSLLVRLFYPLL